MRCVFISRHLRVQFACTREYCALVTLSSAYYIAEYRLAFAMGLGDNKDTAEPAFVHGSDTGHCVNGHVNPMRVSASGQMPTTTELRPVLAALLVSCDPFLGRG
jgi:hypothetical protein